MRAHTARLARPALACLVLASLAAVPSTAQASTSRSPHVVTSTATAATYSYVRSASPARTIVKDSTGAVVATLTDGSRSAVLTGPSRTMSESTTSATVSTTAWVRLLPAPFAGTVDTTWLAAALADRSPDVLAVALQYVTGAATVLGDTGALVSADASYGPLVSGVRQEGSDWNDFLQVPATYDGVVDAPEPAQAGSLDCSGFVRMVFGRRLGYPVSLTPDGVRLPRRSAQMATDGPGTVVASAGTQLTDLRTLLPGDLVLFDASTDDGTAVDHVGVFLGKDSAGHPRFVSSRKTVDGPTMGDVGGSSRLDGTGLYARSLRTVRRL